MAIGNCECGVEPSTRDSGRCAWWLADGLPGFFDPKAASFLLALVPQLEGSPVLQSLFMSQIGRASCRERVLELV